MTYAPVRGCAARTIARAIVDALTAGSMRYQGLLSRAERRAIAEY
jgi:hypothetical protein